MRVKIVSPTLPQWTGETGIIVAEDLVQRMATIKLDRIAASVRFGFEELRKI